MDDKSDDSRTSRNELIIDRIIGFGRSLLDTIIKKIQIGRLERNTGAKKEEQERLNALREISNIISIILNNPKQNISFLVSAALDLIKRFHLEDMLEKLNNAIKSYEEANKLINSTDLNNSNNINQNKPMSLSELFGDDEDIRKAYKNHYEQRSLFNAIYKDPPDEESRESVRTALDKHQNNSNLISDIYHDGINCLHKMNNKIHHFKNNNDINHEENKTKLIQMEAARDSFRDGLKQDLIDNLKARQVANEIDKPAHELSDAELNNICLSFSEHKDSKKMFEELDHIIFAGENKIASNIEDELKKLENSLKLESKASHVNTEQNNSNPSITFDLSILLNTLPSQVNDKEKLSSNKKEITLQDNLKIRSENLNNDLLPKHVYINTVLSNSSTTFDLSALLNSLPSKINDKEKEVKAEIEITPKKSLEEENKGKQNSKKSWVDTVTNFSTSTVRGR